jgi:hypothetical protein
MNATDKLMAWAQIWLSVLLLITTFIATVYYMLMVHGGALSADTIRSIEALLDRMWTACGIVVFFWFQRQRTAGIPDQSQLVTQTHTSPDGTKTTITSPAATTSVVTPGVPNAAPLTASVSVTRVPPRAGDAAGS